MDGFVFLVAMATFAMALVALNRIAKLETRLAQLKLELGNLAARNPATPAPALAEDIAAAIAPLPSPAPAAQEPAPVAPPVIEEVIAPKAPQPDMERALASRWFVWIGGVAIAIGGLLFVKFAYDNGLISPALQIVLGLVAGAALVAAGEWVRRASPSGAGRQDYVPAALSAAGLAVLFGSFYAGHALYGLLGPTLAFAGLAATGLGALALSRRQGPLIAALGLLGSYVTPALIPSPDPSAWGFFAYLTVILVACFAVLRGRDWWWLAYAALAGAAGWAVLWIAGGPFVPAHVWPVGLFAHAMGLVALFGLWGGRIVASDSGSLRTPAAMSRALVIGLAGLAAGALVLALQAHAADHGTAALVLLAAAMAWFVALAWIKPGLSPLAPAAALIMALTLMSWKQAAFQALALDEHGLWTWSNAFGPAADAYLRWMLLAAAGFATAGIAGVRMRPAAARDFGLLGGGAAVLFVWGAWARVDFLLSDASWALLAAAAAALLLAAVSTPGRNRDEPAVDTGAGLLAAGAACLLVFAADRMLDGVWLTIAIAALALAYALAARSLAVKLASPIAAALASLATLRLFLSRELWFDDRGLPLGQHWVLYGYGLPLVLFHAASRALRGAGHLRSAVVLEGLGLGLLISLASLELRVLIGGGITYDEPRFLEMAAHILTWPGAATGLMYRQRLYSSVISLWGARALLALSAVSVVLFSLLSLNPVLTGEPVPGNVVLNALLLAYLAPALLIAFMARRLDVIGWGRARPAALVLALLLAFTYVTLETKRVFQGRLMTAWSQSVAESYAYSAVWLAFALALFVAGIRLRSQNVRLAGLAVMALVVLKVFAWDMSNLAGLLRIASFIGLGFCLVGIGWLYQRFVHEERRIINAGN